MDIVADFRVQHPLATSVVKAETQVRLPGTTVKPESKDTFKRTGTGACQVLPLSHETFGHAVRATSAPQ